MSLQSGAAAVRARVTLLAAAFLLAIPALGAQTNLVMSQAPLLPERFAAWSLLPPPPGSPAPATPPLLTSDTALAAIAKEDGLGRTATASYTRSSGGVLQVQAIQFGDATGAVAAYTFLRRRDMAERPGEPGARNNTNIATAGSRTLLRQGVSLLVLDAVPASAAPTAPDLRALADTLPKIGGPRGLPPLLPTYLPTAGLVPGSLVYTIGPTAYKASGGLLPVELIGFNKAGEAATASFSGRSGTGKLTLLLLPTPQIAGDRGRAIESWLNSPAAQTAGLGAVKLRRIGPMLAMASNGFTADQGKALVDSIHLRTELTWNKSVPPEFHVEVRKTASLLTSIMVFSGVGALAALLLGAFLGFGRAWVRVLMGKPAATEPEFLRLDLRRSDPAAGK